MALPPDAVPVASLPPDAVPVNDGEEAAPRPDYRDSYDRVVETDATLAPDYRDDYDRRAAEPGPLVAPVAPPVPTPEETKLLGERARLMTEHAPASAHEALQYKALYPMFDLSFIQQRLPDFRRQAQIDGVDWETLAREHPALTKLLQDPDKAGMVMQESATLAGAERFLGRLSVYQPSGPGTPMRWDYTAPAPVAALADAFKDASIYHKVDRGVAAVAETLDWMSDLAAKATGTQKGGFFKDIANYWKARAAIWEPQLPDRNDYVGTSFHENGRFMRGAVDVSVSTAKLAPLLLASAATGPAGAGQLTALNTLYTAPDMYWRAREAGAGPGTAAALTALGAPVVGKAMTWTPLGTAAGRTVSATIDRGLANLITATQPSLFRATPLLLARVGVDVGMGQIGLATQSMLSSYVDQTANAIGGKDWDPSAPLTAFFTGLRDPSMLGLHAVGVIREIGRFNRAKGDVERLNRMFDLLEKGTNPQNADLIESAVRDIATPEARTVYVPLDKYHEALEAAGGDPRQVAASIIGDGGKAYDDAVVQHAMDLGIPVEKLWRLKEHGLADLARDEGRFDPKLEGAASLAERAKAAQEAFDAALGLKPPPPVPEGHVRFYHGGVDYQGGKRWLGLTENYARGYAGDAPSTSVFYVDVPKDHPALLEHGYDEVNGVYRNWEAPEDVAKGLKKISGEKFMSPDQKAMYDALLARVSGDEGLAIQRLAEIQKLRTQHPELTVEDAFNAMWGKGGVEGPPLDPANDAVPGMHLESPDSPVIDQLVKPYEGGYTDPKWFKAFQDEQKAESARQAAKLAQDRAREKLREAVLKGTRRFMPEERAKAEEQARGDLRKDPVYRALHFFRTGESWAGVEGERLMRDGERLRLLDSEIDSLMGAGVAEEIKAAVKGVVTSDPRKAIDLDAAANALGFKGTAMGGDPARRMLAGFRGAITESQYVKQLADLRLREKFGEDLLTNPREMLNAILDSVNNEKTVGVMLKTYRALAESLDPVTRARSQLTPETWQDAAERIIQSKRIEESDPEIFARRSMAASKKALEMIDKGKLSPAANHTESAILNHYLYKVAREQTNRMGKAWSEIARKGTSEPSRARIGLADTASHELGQDGRPVEPVYLHVHDALLQAVGIRSSPEGYTPDPAIVQKFIDRISENGHDQNISMLVWDRDVIQGIISGERSWGSLTPDEAANVHQFVTQLHNLGKVTAQASEALRGEQIQTLRAGITSYLRGLNPGEQGPSLLEPKFPRALDTERVERQRSAIEKGWEKVTHALGWGAEDTIAPWNRLAELGPMGEHIMESFRERRNERDHLEKAFFYPWLEIRKQLELDPTLTAELPGADAMLGLQGGANVDTAISKNWLLNFMRWYGDADGRGKLMSSFHLVEPNVLKTITKFITPKEADLIQQEADLIEREMWPRLAASHLRRTGSELTKSQPASYTLTWADGTTREMKGGYFPIHWMSEPGFGQGKMSQFTNSRRPVVPGGFLIERTAAVRIPDLNWAGMPSHMRQVAHNLAFGDFVQDTARVLLDRDVQNMVASTYGDKSAIGLDRWLRRVALDVTGGPDFTSSAAEKNAGLRMMRRAMVRSQISFNYPILFAHSAHTVASGVARYGAGYALDYSIPALADVMEGYTEAMLTGKNTIRERALADFPELQHRAASHREEMNRWMLEREFRATPKNDLQRLVRDIDEHVFEGAGMAHLRFMDEAFSTATAVAKYRHAMDQGFGHDEAVRLAGKEVFETMPTYSQMEQPEILADKNSLRAVGVIWHTYYSKWREMWRDARFEGARRPAMEAQARTGRVPFAANMMNEAQVFGHMMAGLGVALVAGAYFKGAGPEKDEKKSEWIAKRSMMMAPEVLPYAGMLTERAWESIVDRRKPMPVDFANTFLSPAAHTLDAFMMMSDRRKTTEEKTMKLLLAGAELTGTPKHLLRLGQFAAHGDEWANQSPKGAAATSADLAAHVFYPYKWGRARRYQTHNPLMDAASMMEEPK